MKTFGEVIRSSRESKGLYLRQVAAAMDIDQALISKFEKGDRKPSKEQGDWAEDLIFRAINQTSENYVAVRYGKSDDLIAGEGGFENFYNNFQDDIRIYIY